MNNTVIIIPARLGAKRFPNKPLAKINNLPMIIHVLNRAKESNVGDVFVATPDEEICRIVKENGGEAILTQKEHLSGSDRVYEVFSKQLKKKADLIINLQGDMPNINPKSILSLEKFMRNNKCEVGTLAAEIKNKSDISNPNIVKIHTEKALNKDNFLNVKDFFRIKENLSNEKIYHHVGVYAFTSIALTKYVELSRSNLEVERNLEQMRAMENNFIVKAGLCQTPPQGVDTKEDLIKVSKEMN